MKTINGSQITGRDYFSRIEEMERREAEMQADVLFLSGLLIFMSALAIYLVLQIPSDSAKEAPVLVKSEMTKKQVHDLYIMPASRERHVSK